MPPFGMRAARLCHLRARFLATLGMTVGVAENDMRVGAYVRGWRIDAVVLACVRLLRIADDAIIARRSQTSQDDVCATPGKLKEKSERRKSRRVSGKRDSALPQSEIPRCARNDRAALGMRCGWRIHTVAGGAYAPPF